MKLYYAPGACSLAPHIVASEAGIDLSIEKVDLGAKKTETGKDFLSISPKGSVPTLELDNGQILTEGPVISQYLADQKPGSGLAAAAGTMERYRLQETLGYINSEIHKSYSPLFSKDTTPEVREERKAYLRKRYQLLDATLQKQPFLLGDHFSVADAYLFTVTRWAKPMKLDLSEYSALTKFQETVAARPAVRAAMQAEGLEKAEGKAA